MNNDKKNLIGFKSNDIWTNYDLQLFVDSVTAIYNVFTSIKIKQKSIEAELSKSRHMLENYEHYFHKYFDHPMYFEFFELQRRMIKDYLSGKLKELPNIQFPPFILPTQFKVEAKQPTIYEIYSNIKSYQSNDDLLRIHKIYIASPGGFSFEGVGEVLKELREFIKDIWYRNKQERICGQLEIIDKYLSVKNKYENSNMNLPPVSSEDEIKKVLNENVNNLKQLEKENKLMSVAENIDYIP